MEVLEFQIEHRLKEESKNLKLLQVEELLQRNLDKEKISRKMVRKEIQMEHIIRVMMLS